MTKYLLVCLTSLSSDIPATNRRVELLRESWRSSVSSLRDVQPVAYQCGSYCETSSFVGSLKYVSIGRRDPWITFVPECSACVPMLELACSSSWRSLLSPLFCVESKQSKQSEQTVLGLYSDFFWQKIKPNTNVLVLTQSSDCSRTV